MHFHRGLAASLSAQQQSPLVFVTKMYVFVIVELWGAVISATLSSAWGAFVWRFRKVLCPRDSTPYQARRIPSQPAS